VAKVQKNELSEEKELFFYTKSRIYYTNLIILEKKAVQKVFRVCLPSHLPLWRKSASWRSGVCA